MLTLFTEATHTHTKRRSSEACRLCSLLFTLHYRSTILLVLLQANSDSFVVRTLDRKTLWEMQTPQVTEKLSVDIFSVNIFIMIFMEAYFMQIIKPELLRKGFELVNRFVKHNSSCNC